MNDSAHPDYQFGTLLDKLLSHQGTMTSWLQHPGTAHFMEYLGLVKAGLVKELMRESDLVKLARIQGEVARIDKLLRIPEIVRKEQEMEANKRSK